MPKIPTFTSQRSIPVGSPNAPISTEAATATSRAISGLGQDATRLADVLQDRQDKLQARANRNKALLATNLARDKINAYEIEIGEVQGSDAHGLYERSKKRLDEIKEAGGRDLDAGARAIYDEMVNVPIQSSLKSISGQESRKIREFEISNLNSTIARNNNDAIKDPLNIDAVIEANSQWIDEIFPGQDNLVKKEAAISDTIDGVFNSLMLQNPLAAEAFVKEHSDKIDDKVEIAYNVKIKKAKESLKVITDAKEVDLIVAQAISNTEIADPDIPFDIEKRYAEVKKLTDDPKQRKAAYDELQRLQRVHAQSIKEKLDYSYSVISGALQKNENLTINDIEQMPEYAKLPKKEREEALLKADNLIKQRAREERAVVASERSAEAAVRSQENQAKRVQQEKYDKEYNLIMGNETRLKSLKTMSDDEFNGLLLEVGDENQAKLLKERLKLKEDDKYMSLSRQRTEKVNTALDSAGIINPSERALYQSAVIDYIEDETDLSKMDTLIAEALQNATIERRRIFPDRVIINEPDAPFVRQDIVQPVEDQYTVGKIYTDAQGVRAKYLGDGNWQIQ